MFGQLSNRESLRDLIVAIVQHDMKFERSTYEVLQILSISLTDKTPLRELFDKTIFYTLTSSHNESKLDKHGIHRCLFLILRCHMTSSENLFFINKVFLL